MRTRNGSGQSGTRPQYDVNRNYTNEEIGEIVSSITSIVDGKVVLTGDVTDDLKSIVRQYKSGGVAKQGRGILDEYYTDGKIVYAVNLLITPYFKAGKGIRVLEPSVGIGNFVGALRGIPASEVQAFEINDTTARIAKVLYPQVEVNLRSFETEFIDEEGNKKPLPKKYDLVIGNPPYGSHRGLYKGLGEESKIARYEDYFVKRSLDVLNDGGVLAMVLPSSWIDRHTDYGGYTVEAAYRLPSGAFEATQVGTDIVVLRKDSSVPRAERTPYFEQHPERVLGVVKHRKGRYGRLEDYVEGDIDAAIDAIDDHRGVSFPAVMGKGGRIKNLVDQRLIRPNRPAFELPHGKVAAVEDIFFRCLEAVDGRRAIARSGHLPLQVDHPRLRTVDRFDFPDLEVIRVIAKPKLGVELIGGNPVRRPEFKGKAIDADDAARLKQ